MTLTMAQFHHARYQGHEFGESGMQPSFTAHVRCEKSISRWCSMLRYDDIDIKFKQTAMKMKDGYFSDSTTILKNKFIIFMKLAS